MRACVIGVGNPVRGDDGIGLTVIERLRVLLGGHGVAIYAVGERLFDIPALIGGHRKAVLIDSLPPETAPGQLRITRLSQECLRMRGDGYEAYSLHDLDLVWQLQYVYQSGFQGEILLVGIEAESLSYRNELSNKLKQILPEMIPIIAKQIRQFLQD